jgi:hypothetical protein
MIGAGTRMPRCFSSVLYRNFENLLSILDIIPNLYEDMPECPVFQNGDESHPFKFPSLDGRG